MPSAAAVQMFMCPVRPEDCAQHEKGEDGLCPLYNPECTFDDRCPLYFFCPFSIHINFNTFARSFNAMFLVMTGEEWTQVMYAGMRLHRTPFLGVSFFVVAYALLTYIFLNCFIAGQSTNLDVLMCVLASVAHLLSSVCL